MSIRNTLFIYVNKLLLILDVDGVLTDGKKFYGPDGLCAFKSFNDRDFTAIKKFKSIGMDVVFLSGDKTINEPLAKNRNIDFYCSRGHKDCTDKSQFIPLFEKKYDVTTEQMIYIGDDIFDINIMKSVKYSFCPKDSPYEVKNVSKVLNCKSGENCLTELYEHLLENKIIVEYDHEKLLNFDKNEKF